MRNTLALVMLMSLGAHATLAGQDPRPTTAGGRSTVYAPNGVIATSQPLATSAGLAVLQAGGNAVDAAVTAAAVLSVVEPHMTGIGGDMFAILWSARDRQLFGLKGHGRAGGLMTRDELVGRGYEQMPTRGVEAVTVPGALRGWADLLERHGTITLAQALDPAIQLAERGFPVTPIIVRDWRAEVDVLKRNAGAAATYLIDGERAPHPGGWFTNPDYAASLRMIAEEGPSVFYGGALGERLVSGVRELGGFLTIEDLREHRSEWVEPISAMFHGYRVWEIPPPGQGIAALQMLRILEPYPLEQMGHNSAEYLHHLIEAKKLAYADLSRFVADPEFMDVTPAELLSDRYIEARRALIDPYHALERAEPGEAITASETIYLSVADAEGNMVSFINSIFSAFGSGIVVPGTGFALQNRGAGFTLELGHPNQVAPGKAPFHTIIPAFVTKPNEADEEESWLSFGVMGGAMQPQGHVQVLLNLLVFGMDLQDAIDAARFRHYSDLRVGIEAQVGHEARAALAAKGHDVIEIGPGAVGGAQATLRLDRGWAAGSDPRKDGHAAGH